MPAIKANSKRMGEFLPRICDVRSGLGSLFLGMLLMLACSFGCGPSSSQALSGPASNDVPEITEETIHERINYTRVREVPEENGTAEPIVWNFDEDEPKEIAVIDKQMDGDRATIILNIKTRAAPGVRNPRQLAGQIRTEWELETGWVLRRWEIVKTENISMKYKNLPKPPTQNTNTSLENISPPAAPTSRQ